MAADVPVGDSSLNPCCTRWKDKYLNLEKGRKFLRQAIKLLEDKYESLNKAYEEERVRAQAEKDEKEKEVAMRVSLENEMSALKSEISLLKQKGSAGLEDKSGEVKFLQDCVAKGDKEISKLKELLEKEKLRADSEKKNAEAEKKSAAEARKRVKEEKAKAAEERKYATIEGKKAEEYRIQLEGLKKEADEANSKLVSLTLKIDEVNMELEAEKFKVIEERKRADSEMAKAEEHRKLAEASGLKAREENSRAENLSCLLEDARRRIEELLKEEEYRPQLEDLKKESDKATPKLVSETSKVVEANEKVYSERCKVSKRRKCNDSEAGKSEEQRKLAEANAKIMEETHHAEHLSKQLEDARQRIVELQKAEKYQLQFEALRKEIDETKSKLVSEALKFKGASSKLEVEKNRLIKERERADSAMVKAEEQRKLAEDHWKMAVDEKSRADQLAGLLEQDRLKIEVLQKELQELLSSRKVAEASAIPPGKDVSAEAAKVKLLKKQLKLEKMRVKHAKQVAKLVKSQSSVLLQELARLKLDFTHISCRFDALTKCFLVGTEYMEDKDKTGNFANMQKPKLNREPWGFEPENGSRHEPSCIDGAAPDSLRQSLHCNSSLFPVSDGNYPGSISGIDSKFESVVGASNRKLLQSSAINSCTASFSDGQLVGSQERGDFVTTSGKFVEGHFNAQPTISTMSGEVTKVHHNNNLPVAAENSVGSPHSIDGVGRVKGCDRKRRRMLDAIESVESMYTEGKRLHLRMGKKLSVLHGMLNRKINKALEEQNYVETDGEGGSYPKFEWSHKKSEPSHEMNVVMPNLSDLGEPEKSQIIGNEVCDDVNTSGQALASNDVVLGPLQACGDGLSDLDTLANFEALAIGDYMKLLELDNSADEDCYRRAMESPMSPTVPVIGFPMAEIFDKDKFSASFDESFCGLPNDKGILVPSHSFDVIDVEIGSCNLKGNASASGTSYTGLLHENEELSNSFYVLGKGDGIGNAVESEKAYCSQNGDSRVEVEIPNIPRSGEKEVLRFPLESDLGGVSDSIPSCLVIFSNNNDSQSISRIFCATGSCMVNCSLDTRTECMMQKILRNLKMEERILPKEKACTFFSLLLMKLSVHALWESGSCLGRDFVSCLDLFSRRINAMVSNVETRSLFAEMSFLDELLGLIENFLVERKVVAYPDVFSEPLSEGGSMSVLLDGEKINLISTSASADQLVAGGVILSSICAAIGRIGFICEVSYSLLLMRKCDTAVVLTILHVFAHICGENFFCLENYSLTMTVVKSIVMFLEGKDSSVVPASGLSPADEARIEFSPWAKCPFLRDALSIDIVTSELLENLHLHALSETMHRHLKQSTSWSKSNITCHEGIANESLNYEEVNSVLDANNDACCNLNKCGVTATQSKAAISETLCDLSDLLSLVELLAWNMSWEWTYGKIIPVLLALLEKTKLDYFAVAVIVLLGKLGRLGIEACGCEDKRIESLRCKLSSYLSWDTTSAASFPIQIATITALLELLPLDFENIMQSNLKFPAIAREADCIHVIRNWFSSLNEEQQVLSFGLLQSAGVG